MSRFAFSSPFFRRSSSLTSHSANPMASGTVSPASSNRFFRSFSVPPPFVYSSNS